MRTLLAISPHLDDAVFSAGATLWSEAQTPDTRVIVATVFTGNVADPTGFALACQIDKGLPPEIDYMALRREEDRAACTAIGAEPLHLPLLEAPHRGYGDPAALFGPVHSKDPARDAVGNHLEQLLLKLRPDRLLGPLAIGGHVDHVIVRDALAKAAGRTDLWLWEDWPYVDRAGPRDRSRARHLPHGGVGIARKLVACSCYRSQMGFQFGGTEALKRRLEAQEGEWFVAEQDGGTVVNFMPGPQEAGI